MLARFGDGANHRRTLDRFQVFEFFFQSEEALGGHRDLDHRNSTTSVTAQPYRKIFETKRKSANRPGRPGAPLVPAAKILPRLPLGAARSEGHTSELQSLMRISYAVFCLKNKINTQTT